MKNAITSKLFCSGASSVRYAEAFETPLRLRPRLRLRSACLFLGNLRLILPPLILVACLLSLSACASPAIADPPAATPAHSPVVLISVPNASPTPTPFQPVFPTATAIPPTPTLTPTASATPAPTTPPTATWIHVGAGQVTAPILLYHHIGDVSPANRYYISPDDFRQQMERLINWGYTSITPSYLANVLVNGGELPERPVVITFDDANLDVYTNAFPMMKELGLVGAVYVVTFRMESGGYINADQLKEMAAAGWEIGSHSQSHYVLNLNYDVAAVEICQSRTDLETATGAPVLSFAYPNGVVDNFIVQQVKDCGYTSGMWLGTAVTHYSNYVYYLIRREVEGSFDLDRFGGLLPWTGPIPTATPTAEPTPTETASSP